ncbi:autotransporter outer membrane beta-barrel domain-containing protein [Variovorax boronicumulans]|uniref:autotransporter outer membrane beta-barrel domain-containing protein n=1 Tax=Variovorax boronicumulans TaxID=436515 RepID=UPI00339AD404
MNIFFRSLWNNSLGAWVAVSEIAAARGKPQRSSRGATAADGERDGCTPFRLSGLMAAVVMTMAGAGLAVPASAQNLVIGTVGAGGAGVNAGKAGGAGSIGGGGGGGSGGGGAGGGGGGFGAGGGGAGFTFGANSGGAGGVANGAGADGGSDFNGNAGAGNNGGSAGTGGVGGAALVGTANGTLSGGTTTRTIANGNTTITGSLAVGGSGGGGGGGGGFNGGGNGTAGGAGVLNVSGGTTSIAGALLIGGSGGGGAGGTGNGPGGNGGAGGTGQFTLSGGNLSAGRIIVGGSNGGNGSGRGGTGGTGGAGTLTITAGSLTATGGIMLNGSGRLVYNGSGSLTGAYNISGAGSVTQSGSGTTTLSGANTYTGGTTISGGTLQVASDANLGGATGSLTFNNGGTLRSSAGLTSARNVTLTGNGSITTANGALAMNGVFGGNGSLTVNAGANAITMTNGANNFGGTVNLTGGTTQITDATALTLGTLNTGALTVNSSGALNLGTGTVGSLTANSNGGNVSQGGPLTVTGAGSINAGAGSITLDNPANNFVGALSLTGGTTSIRDTNLLTLGTISTGALTVVSNGTLNLGSGTATSLSATSTNAAITQTGGLNVTGTSRLEAGSADIALTQATNKFGGAVGFTGRNVALTNSTGLVLGAGTATGAFAATAAGDITQTAALVVAGTSTLNAGNADILLTQATNKLTGAVVANGRNVALTNTVGLTLGASTITGTLSATAVGEIQQTGALNVTGTSTLNAGAADITLAQATNKFGGAVSANGRNVAITSGGALALGTSAITGTLAATAAGAITQTGALSVAGASTLNAGSADITLTQATNKFTGAVATNGRNVSLTNGTALVLGTGTIAGTLAATATGAITQTGALTVAGAATVNAGANAITLLNANNDFGGILNLTGGATQVNDVNGLTLGSLGTGALTVTSHGALGLGSGTAASLDATSNNGTITQTGALVIAGTSKLTAGTGAVALDNGANDFVGAVTVSGSSIALTDVNNLNVASLTNGTNGAVSLVAGGTLTLPAAAINTGNAALTLAANGGALSVNNALAGGAVSLTARDGITLGSDVTASGALALNGGKSITQTAGTITAATLTGSATGAVSLNSVVNQVGALGNFTANGFSLATSSALAINGNVAVGSSANFNSGGAITQGAGSVVTAGTLTGTSVAGTTLTGANQIDTLGAFTAKGFSLTNGKALTVSGPLVSTAGVALATTAGNLAINSTVGGAGVSLNAAGAITQGAGSVITATSLSGAAAGDATLGGANQIGVLGNFNAANLSLRTVLALTVSGDVAAGNVALDASKGAVVTGSIQASGSTTIAAGTSLQIGNGGTTGTLAGNVIDNGALSFNRSDAVGFAGNIGGTGTLTQAGPGTLTLTGIADHTGGTTVAAGRLQIGNGSNSGSIAGNITNNSELAFNRSDAVTFGGVVGGSGNLIQRGSGTLNLTAASTYTGSTFVEAGTLRVNNATGSATGSGNVFVSSGATLGGAGTIAGAVNIADGGILAAGNSPGTLNTGALSFSSGSVLSYELGQAGVPGGALNDLINVSGNLTLDGRLDVAQSAGGTFGPGLYRLVNYTGSLTDNGLNVGTVPGGTVAADLSVQTSVAQQVNLVNRAGFSLNFWDGSNGGDYNNSKVNGGSGTWRVGAPGDGWTDMDGGINAAWKQDQFAIFGGTAGTVAVDKSGGTVSIGGAQFMVDGYVVQGDELNISGAGTVVRVGDGTAGGAAMTATINSAITGTGGLSKEDVGTLVLGGANTYSGGTAVKAGVLQGNTTSLQGDIVNDAKLTFDQAVDGVYAGTLSGTGSLRKIGAGELQLTAANSYGGGTQVDAGTVNAAITGALGTGPVNVASGAGLVFSGAADAGTLQITAAAANLGNGGFVQFKDNASAGNAALVTQQGGSIDVRDNATAGNATIENRGGETTVWFNATAGKARITNYAGGSTNFLDNGSAGQSTLVNETGGLIDFFDTAKADQATLVNNAGGTVRISKLGADGITVGSIEGAGRVLLGAKALTTGGLNTDTEVSGVISGVGGSVVKVGTGALTLSGANTYTGGTALHQGRLNVGHNEALGTGALAMDDDTTLGFSADGLNIANAIQLTGQNDPVIDTGAFAGTLSGAISGAGFITKEGTGTLTLSGANTYTGATAVAQGTLKAGAADTFSAGSAHSVAAGATLDLAGFNQTVKSLANSGTVSLVGIVPGTTLTVNGNYVGNNGVLKLGTALNSGTGPSDRLVINGGAASGKTTVQIANLGGLGARTIGNGVEVITAQNGATTTAQTTKDAFALAGGHVDAGAYEYRLYAADTGGAGENWYLRTDPEPTAASRGLPAYRVEAALYAALPSQLRQGDLAMLGDLRKRVGDDDVKGTTPVTATPTGSGRRAWARVLSTDIDIQQGGTVSPTSKGRLTGFQAGTDLLATPNWRAGVYVGQLDGDATVNGLASGVSNLRVGRNDLRSQYVGIYGTYTGDSGFYADAVVQSGRHRYTVQPNATLGAEGKGNSLLGSIEVGQAFALGSSGWSIEPQLQLIHQHLDLGNSAILGAVVQPQADNGWIARAGVRVKGQIDTGAGMLQPYGRFNVYKTSSGADIARFVNGATTTDIAAPTGGTSTELAGGFTLSLSESTSLYGEVGKLWASGGNAKVKSSINGSLGVRVKW